MSRSPRSLSDRIRLLGAFLLIGNLPAPDSPAEWMYIAPMDNLVSSDLIVVGVLEDPILDSIAGIDYESGTIAVAEVVVGPPVPDRSVTLRWSNPTGRICPRVDNATHEATKKLWLLTLGDDGDYRADNPWRVIDLEDLTERSQARELWEELRRLEPDRRSPAQESVLAFLDRLLVAPAGS